MISKRTAPIIGAGPAGLTAALEFLKQSEIQPIVPEASREIGGLARTVRYKGNRMEQYPEYQNGAGLSRAELLQNKDGGCFVSGVASIGCIGLH